MQQVNRAIMAGVFVVGAAGVAAGDVVYTDAGDRPVGDFSRVGFEGVAPGETIESLDFGGGVSASVSSKGAITNAVFAETDGHGAVQAEGERFWKLAGGETTLDFGSTRLGAFEFMYSDLEWTTLEMDFGDAGHVELEDSNSEHPKLFGFAAEEGDSFSEVTLRWQGRQNDGIGFDQVGVAATPTPGSVALLGLAGGAAVGRRRR